MSNIEDRLDIAAIGTEQRQALRELAPIMQTALPEVLTAFYEHIGVKPEVNRFFSSEQVKKHAAQMQIDHWNRIMSGEFGTEYLNSVRKIGETHARIGLEPKWYIAGYSFLASETIPLLADHCYAADGQTDESKAKFDRLSKAFLRAAMLDMDLAIDVYLNDDETRKKQTAELADQFEQSVGSIVDVVAGAATSLSETSQGMTKSSEETASRAMSVSAAIEEATSNVSTVAASTQELGKSVQEISSQIGVSTELITQAVGTAQETTQIVASLTGEAEKVGEVIALISDIAAQTNLLALNATIESARAGEAGRGFAVVASEVKTLASQTAGATDSISRQINEMQNVTRRAADAIENIRAKIDELSGVSTAIGAAIEEQVATTQEIARNTEEAAVGNREVSGHMSAVQVGATETQQAVGVVAQASSELGEQADRLKGEVAGFLNKLKAS